MATGRELQQGEHVTTELTKEQKVKIVQHYSEDQRSFTAQSPARDNCNYGLNPNQDPALLVQSIPFQMSQILQSLNVVPQISETKTFKNIKLRAKGDVSRYLRVNNELQMAMRGAQASQLDQFDYVPKSQKVVTKILDEHRKEYQNLKSTTAPNIKPLGTLLTTLYEHTSAVNTVTVTDDEKFFMTGSRLDKEIQIWQVKNIQEDTTSKSIHTLETKSHLNQLCLVNNSNTLAAATSMGIELYDMSRVF